MGVRNLWDVIESCKKVLPLHHLQNKRVCIDLSCWIVKLHTVNKSHQATQEKGYLKGLFHRLRALLALNCTLIFVTDGSIPAIKLATYRRRLNSGHEVTQDETHLLNGTSLPRNMGSEFSCMIKEAKVLGLALGIPCLDGIEEAEAQCALLNYESLCDGCFTSDSDAFLFGARTVYREICLGEGGHVVCYEMADIERKLGYGRNSLITLALLLGSDYSTGVRGLGLESACQIITSVGDGNALQLIASEGVNFVKKTKVSKQTQRANANNGSKLLASETDVNGNDSNLERQNQFLQVIDAYLKPKCHSADSDAVYRVLAQHPFQCFKLQQICFRFFKWSPEKTDEYILLKVAERDLRRFANLRLVSSKLGVIPPLHQIPVKCPVSKIVKPRKVKGRECFEVLWDGFDGLETSIVPADLLESACPEKIAEFAERKAMEKKQKQCKPRTKKSESMFTATELDLKLQSLMLDIESGDGAVSAASLSRTKKSERTSTAAELDLNLQSLMLDIESGDRAVSSASLSKAMILKDTTNIVAAELVNQDCFHSRSKNDAQCQTNVAKILAKNEVIDLLSPSPQIRPYRAPRCQQRNNECIDVINLSDSETELSPKHFRDAGNLKT